MLKSISLPYGGKTINVVCPSDAKLYTIIEPVKGMDPSRFAGRLKATNLQPGFDPSRPAVVVADKTRLCGYPQYLPVLLDWLIDLGADPDAIKLYIAYGTHMRQSDEACRKAYGSVYDAFQWIHHDCEEGPFHRLGETRRGTPVHFRRDLMQASCVVTFGAISHHYFAGFGGGRKLIFPGLGQKESIYANHSLFLERSSRSLAAGCCSGRLDGNPLAEDLAEIESYRPADMAIHGILNSRGEVCDLMVGQGAAHFKSACTRHADTCEVPVKRRYDLVVASCGGFPKDINFIQSHKAIHHAADFTADGGRLIVLAECRDGVGSRTFLPWFEMGGREAAFGELARQYVGNGGTALAMMAKLDRIKISIVTQLDPGTAGRIGFECIAPDRAQALVERHSGSMAVIPNASVTVRKVDTP